LLRASGIHYTYRWHLSDQDILLAYQESDLVAFVSTYEGFGMPILEGQAVGRPVITSDLLSMPEVAGGAACLVDPFDTRSIRAGLDRVITDHDYREELISRGYRNVLRFDPDAIAMAYLDIYRRLLAG
jgi:glycosyltransferase involved in cell wall biosynthesis